MDIEERMNWFDEMDAIQTEISKGAREHVALLRDILRAWVWPFYDGAY